ncbi:MAG: hypothetical protein JST82_01120 [Bacteroidetes bacterium]|nr:hypothetical protein [Bacteroidota bacterium]
MMNGMKLIRLSLLVCLSAMACKKDKKEIVTGTSPDTAEKVAVDRFSAAAGHLQVRDASNGLPAANAPIDFDKPPFITQGYGPSGNVISYYNFDVQPETPAPIYVLVQNGTPVSGQLNIIDVIPGDANYNDFWLVNTVEVPSDYVANTITSYQQIKDKGYTISATTHIVNCPVVPSGSTASKRLNGESTGIIRGWYKNKVVSYFTFGEKDLNTVNGKIPVAPIYVTFNINPNQPNGGPSSGFKMEMSSLQTHNIASVLPADAGYSPLWSVDIYDNANFSMVSNLSTAQAATSLATNAALVNCPIVAK